MADLLETPSRLLKRVQQYEDVDLPSLPSISHDVDCDQTTEYPDPDDSVTSGNEVRSDSSSTMLMVRNGLPLRWVAHSPRHPLGSTPPLQAGTHTLTNEAPWPQMTRFQTSTRLPKGSSATTSRPFWRTCQNHATSWTGLPCPLPTTRTFWKIVSRPKGFLPPLQMWSLAQACLSVTQLLRHPPLR